MIANPERKVVVMALIATALVSWRELKRGEVPPPPSAYVGTAIVYGVAHIIAEAQGQIGVYLAFGWTLWIAYSSVENKLPAPKHQAVRPAAAKPSPAVRRSGHQPRTPALARPRHRGQVGSRKVRKG